jgi:hypothetical protein
MALSTLRRSGAAAAAPAARTRAAQPVVARAPAAPRGLPALPARARRTAAARVVAAAAPAEPVRPRAAAAPAPAAAPAALAPAPRPARPQPLAKLQNLLSGIMKGAAIAAVAVALVSCTDEHRGGARRRPAQRAARVWLGARRRATRTARTARAGRIHARPAGGRMDGVPAPARAERRAGPAAAPLGAAGRPRGPQTARQQPRRAPRCGPPAACAHP